MKNGEELKREYLARLGREADKLPPTTLLGGQTFTREGMFILQKQLDLLLSAHFAREAEKETS